MSWKFNPFTQKLDAVTDPAGSTGQIQFNNGGAFGGGAIYESNGMLGIGTSSPTAEISFAEMLGPELCTNPSFAGSATGWTLGSGWTYASNSVSFAYPGGPTGQTLQSNSVVPVPGQLYKISITFSSVSCPTGTQFNVMMGNGEVFDVIAAGTYTYYDIASANNPLYVDVSGDISHPTCTITNFSCKAVISSENTTGGNYVNSAPSVFTNSFILQGVIGSGSYPLMGFAEKPTFFWYPNKGAFFVGTPGFGDWTDDQIGQSAICMGYSSNVGGDYGIAIGAASRVDNDFSLSIGSANQLLGQHLGGNNFVIGAGNMIDATGYNNNSIILGINCSSYFVATNSLLFGTGHQDSGFASVIIGNNNIGDSTSIAGTMIGNTLTVTANTTYGYSTIIGTGDVNNGAPCDNNMDGSTWFVTQSTVPTLVITLSDQTGSPITGTGRVLIATTTDNGTDKLQVNGTIRPTGYKSSDGSAGMTGTLTTASLVGKTVTIKSGLIVSIA